MSQQHSFRGKRADKISVNVVADPGDEDDDDVMVIDGRIRKEVEYYTITCDECGGDGYYEERGEVICEDCGLVLSGDDQVTLPVDYSGSRGFTGQDPKADADDRKGIVEPSI